MSNKNNSELSAEILIAVINKAPSTGSVKTDAERAAEAFKVIFAAVTNPR